MIKVISAIFLAIGIYVILGVSARYPPWKTARAIEKMRGEKLSLSDRFIFPVARLIEPLIHLTPFRRNTLEDQLKAAGENDVTPEFYIAVAVVQSGIYVVMGLLLFPICAHYPIVSLGSFLLFILAVKSYFKLRKVPESDIRREKIEREAPRFTSYFVQSLPEKQPVVKVIEGYRDIAGKELGKELDILITDMHTGAAVPALVEFQSRIDSPIIDELVKYLIGLEQGDDMQVQLQNLEILMNEHDRAEKNKEADKRSDELYPTNWAFFGSLILNVAVILGTIIYQNIFIFGG